MTQVTSLHYKGWSTLIKAHEHDQTDHL